MSGRRASGPHVDNVHGEPGSEAIHSELREQAQSAKFDDVFAAETPAEHIRNALQLLEAREYDVPALYARLRRAMAAMQPGGVGKVPDEHMNTFVLVDVAVELLGYRRLAAERLLRVALERLELTAAVPPPRESCIYCGCTEFSPCALDVGKLSAKDQAALGAYFHERAQAVPNPVACWWMIARADDDPPVCSNPECVAKHAQRGDVPERKAFEIAGHDAAGEEL